MGIERTDYIIVGIDIHDLDINFFENEDKWLKYIEGHRGIECSIIIDQIHGNYTFFGKIIRQSDNYDTGPDVKIIDEEDIVDAKLTVLPKANLLFDKNYMFHDIKVFAFTNYS